MIDNFKEACEKIKEKWTSLINYKQSFDYYFDFYFDLAKKERKSSYLEQAHLNISKFHQELLYFRTSFNNFLGNKDKLRMVWQEYETHTGEKITPDPYILKIRAHDDGRFSMANTKLIEVGQEFLDHGLFGNWHVYPADTFMVVGFLVEDDEEKIILLYRGDNKKYNNKTITIDKEQFSRMF